MAAINLFFDEVQTIPPLNENLEDYFEIETYDEVHDLVPNLELTHEDLIDEFDDDEELNKEELEPTSQVQSQ